LSRRFSFSLGHYTVAKDHVLAASSSLRFSGIIQLKLHIASSLKHRQKFPKCQNNSSNTSEFPHNNAFFVSVFVFASVVACDGTIFFGHLHSSTSTTTTTIIKSSCRPEIDLNSKLHTKLNRLFQEMKCLQTLRKLLKLR
jgi:hypothetical protein